MGALVGGWSCSGTGPTQFDGGYAIERLPTRHSYLVYAEQLNGAVDPGWPALQGCVVPPVDISFPVRTRPGS